MQLLKSHSELIEGLSQNKSVSEQTKNPNVKKVCSNCNKIGHSIETCWQNRPDRPINNQVQLVPQHVPATSVPQVQQTSVPPVQPQSYVPPVQPSLVPHVQPSYVPPVQLQSYVPPVPQQSYVSPVQQAQSYMPGQYVLGHYIHAPVVSNQSVPRNGVAHEYATAMQLNNHVQNNQNPT